MALSQDTNPSPAEWASSLQEFRGHRRGRWRRLAKSGAILGMNMADSLLRGFRKDPMRVSRVQFVYLHHVFPDEMERFRAMVRQLSSIGRFASYSEAVRLAREGPLDGPVFSISFDDGLQTCLDAGRVLEDSGISACFFVCPEVIDHSNDKTYVARWCVDRLHNRPTKVLSWKEVETLIQWGHEVGNHTATHADLGRLDQPQLADEIARSRNRLVQLLGPSAGRHFAWPYGEARHFSDAAMREVVASGHASCASAIRGAHNPTSQKQVTHVLRDHVIFTGHPSELDWFLRYNGQKRIFALG